MATYVLLHGAFMGGWCWRDVAARLRAAGHDVTTPTQTGVGERRHLLSAQITLETFVTDLTSHIEAEELSDIILVGHSFGGQATSGAAERLPGRIRRLVYLDSMVLEGGQSAFDRMDQALVKTRKRLAAEQGAGIAMPVPPIVHLGMGDDHPLAAWTARRMTPHPISTYMAPMPLRGPVGNGLPRTYIACSDPWFASLGWSRDWVRAQVGWDWQEIATGHAAMITAPEALTRMLLAFA